MIRVRRLNEVRGVLERDGAVQASELATRLGVSRETIRRDLLTLEQDGFIVRCHGGGIRHDHVLTEHPRSVRALEQEPAKEVIAAFAAQLVEEGHAVALDASTTTHALAEKLRGRDITLVTNSIAAATALDENSPMTVILTGGQVNQANQSMVGAVAENAARSYSPDIAFLSAPAVGLGGVMETDLGELALKRALAADARRIYVLADHRKFERSAFVRVFDWAEVDALVTDERPSTSLSAVLEDNEVELMLAARPTATQPKRRATKPRDAETSHS